ncbi:10570_t:CDS:1 [Ambispora gerdemannii]|uniref:10570_t:CDS:1 n=1 Tax=Ambispora gerdemannii TaxID=144530 RepID=A0A9N9CM87_9GLOM|nr:10570_t:CDS:1 [Ambispora gerdemannii]
MNKQTSSIFFLVTLTIFAFVFFPSANATPTPKTIEKRAVCPQIVDYCTFEPQSGNAEQIVLGQITFTQFTDCKVRITGQLNTVHGSSKNYDVHIVKSVATKDSPIFDMDFILKDQIDVPFETTLPVSPVVPFTDLKNYICIVMYEDSKIDDQVLGTAQIKQV